MKTITHTLLVTIIVLITIVSCSPDFFDKPIDINVDSGESKLAITAFINRNHTTDGIPEETFNVLVSYTNDPLEQNYEPQIIENATVTLTGNNQSISFNYNDNYFYTPTEEPVFIPETLYTITVEAPGYETVTASQVVPQNVEINQVENTGNHFKVSFNDNPNQKDFYLLEFYREEENGDFITIWVEPFGTILDESGLCNSCVLFNDNTFNGEQNFEVVVKHYEEDNGQSSASNYVAVLYHITEDYFKYDTSIRINNYAEDNPFVEPVIIHSNVSNGFGIFALMSKSSYSFDIE